MGTSNMLICFVASDKMLMAPLDI